MTLSVQPRCTANAVLFLRRKQKFKEWIICSYADGKSASWDIQTDKGRRNNPTQMAATVGNRGTLSRTAVLCDLAKSKVYKQRILVSSSIETVDEVRRGLRRELGSAEPTIGYIWLKEWGIKTLLA